MRGSVIEPGNPTAKQAVRVQTNRKVRIMNVILLDNVENLGGIGDMVSVKAGYGRNYLLPQGKAALATKDNIAEFESRRAGLEKAAGDELAAAKAREALMQNMELVIAANAGPEGKLFGSVGPIDIADALSKVGVEVQRSEIRMPDGPIHDLGDFTVGVHLHTQINVEVLVKIVAED
jgi:large subunit ribosomal protein L9